MRFFELGWVVLGFRWEDERVAFTGDCAETLRTETENLNISGRTTGSRSPAGPRRLGTATRISASLSRRLSAFFGSAPGQDPKTAKFAALPPGHAEFPKRAERSEGSDTTPTQNTTCFAVCALVCDFSPKAECVPAFTRESERGPFVREAEKRDERWPEMELLLMVVVHREPGNVCI